MTVLAGVLLLAGPQSMGFVLAGAWLALRGSLPPVLQKLSQALGGLALGVLVCDLLPGFAANADIEAALLPAVLAIAITIVVFRPKPPTVLAAAAICATLITTAWFTAEEPTRKTLDERLFVTCLIDHEDAAKQVCEANDGQWRARACRCRLPRATP